MQSKKGLLSLRRPTYRSHWRENSSAWNYMVTDLALISRWDEAPVTPLGSMGYASCTRWGDHRNVSVGRNRDYCKGTHQITGDSWDWSCSKSQAICLYIHKSKRFSKSNYSIYLNPFADITSKACGSCNHTNTSKHDFTWQLQAVRLQLTPQAAMTIWETLNHSIHRN